MGRTDFAFLKEGIGLYGKRIERYINFEMIEIPDKKVQASDSAVIMKKEAELFSARISDADFLVLLDERGKEFSSPELAEFLEKKISQSVKQLVFLIGGAYGFHESIQKRANMKLSLSKFTFSHQLVRVIFLEQLYRAFTIIKGEPYHHSG